MHVALVIDVEYPLADDEAILQGLSSMISACQGIFSLIEQIAACESPVRVDRTKREGQRPFWRRYGAQHAHPMRTVAYLLDVIRVSAEADVTGIAVCFNDGLSLIEELV